MSQRRFESAVSSHEAARRRGSEAASCCRGQKVPSGLRFALHFIKLLPNWERHVPGDAPSEFPQPAAHGRAVMRRYRRVPGERRVHCSHLTPSFGDVRPGVLILALLRLRAYLQPQEQSGFSLWDFGAVSQQRQRAENRSHGAS